MRELDRRRRLSALWGCLALADVGVFWYCRFADTAAYRRLEDLGNGLAFSCLCGGVMWFCISQMASHHKAVKQLKQGQTVQACDQKSRFWVLGCLCALTEPLILFVLPLAQALGYMVVLAVLLVVLPWRLDWGKP